MRDQRRQGGFVFRGGLDFETPGLSIEPGRMLACLNYEVDTSGGYTRSLGYERYDGHPSPAEAATAQERDSRREVIDDVPGSGPIRGVHRYEGTVYAWRDNAAGDALVMHKATATGWEAVNVGTAVLAPGGRVEAINYTFKATDADRLMVGCDGVNKAFTFDGTTYTEITITGETAPPKFVAALNNYLFLLLEKGLLYYSVVGVPTDFDPVSDAGVIGVGGTGAGLKVTVNGALAILMKERVSFLYGSAPSNWQLDGLREHDSESGVYAYSAAVFDSIYFVGDSGLTSLSATDRYGNFRAASLSRGVYPFFREKGSQIIGSYPVRAKNQIRLVFPGLRSNQSEILTYTFGQSNVTGWSRQVIEERITTLADSDGDLGRVYAGTQSGKVIQLEKGNSFDGEPIEAYIRTAFWFADAPQIQKQFMRAVVSIQAQSDLTLKVKPLFNYGDPAVSTHPYNEYELAGGGSVWNEGDWNEFKWSQPLRSEIRTIALANARAVGFLFHSVTNHVAPHTLYDTVITYKPRRQRR